MEKNRKPECPAYPMYRHLGTEQADILLHEFGLGFILFHDPSDREYLASTEDLVMWLYSPDYRNSNLCKPQTLRVNGPGGPYPQRVAKGIRYRLHPFQNDIPRRSLGDLGWCPELFNTGQETLGEFADQWSVMKEGPVEGCKIELEWGAKGSDTWHCAKCTTLAL